MKTKNKIGKQLGTTLVLICLIGSSLLSLLVTQPVSAAYGDITPARVSSYEWDSTSGVHPDTIHLGTGEYYLVASKDSGNNMVLSTLHVWNSNGTIQQSVVDSYTIETTVTDVLDYPSLIHISGEVYAVAYGGLSKLKIRTFTAYSSNGTIAPAAIDTFQLTATQAYQNQIAHVTGNIYSVVCRNVSMPGTMGGKLITIYIDTSGNIGSAINDSVTYNASAYFVKQVSVDSNTVAIAYCTGTYGGGIVTYNISAAGDITNTPADTWVFSSAALHPNIYYRAGIVYMMSYRNSTSGDGWLTTLNITTAGAITHSFIDTLDYETGSAQFPSMCAVSGDIYALTYRGGTDDGYVKTMSVTSAGDISTIISLLDYETDTVLFWAPMIHVYGNYYLMVYPGTDTAVDGNNDGWAVTVEISTNFGNSAPELSAPSPANAATGVARPPTSFSITIYDADDDTMNITWYENHTVPGTWRAFNTTTNKLAGTYTVTNTSWVAHYSTKFWWAANVSDGMTGYLNTTYYFTTMATPGAQEAPVVTLYAPLNGSTGIDVLPELSVTIYDANYATQDNNITWSSNSSGSWLTFGTNLSVIGNTATYTQVDANFSLQNTTYWWKVVVNDSNGGWANATYHFTTTSAMVSTLGFATKWEVNLSTYHIVPAEANYSTAYKASTNPVSADVDGDGTFEVYTCIGVPHRTYHTDNGTIYAVSARDGTTLWHHFGKNYGGHVILALHDINSDGILELIAAGYHNITAFNAVTGAVLYDLNFPINRVDKPFVVLKDMGTVWLYTTKDRVITNEKTIQKRWASNGTVALEAAYPGPRYCGGLTAADFDDDGAMEIIATDINTGTGHQGLSCWNLNLTQVWVDADINCYIGQAITIADQNSDGCYDLVVAAPSNLYIISGDDGTTIRSHTFVSNFPTVDVYAPVVADTDGDGHLEAFVCSDGPCYVYDLTTWALDGTMLRYDGYSKLYTPPIIANVYSDSTMEILSITSESFQIMNGTGFTVTGYQDGYYSMNDRVLVLDVDGDGRNEIIFNTLKGGLGIDTFAWFTCVETVGSVNNANTTGKDYNYNYNRNRVAAYSIPFYDPELDYSVPPNYAPVISTPTPADGAVSVSANTTALTVVIHDLEGDSFNYTIETSPDIGSKSVNVTTNGTKSCTVDDLEYSTLYTWYVNTTDGASTRSAVYTFTTEEEPSNTIPENETSTVTGGTLGTKMFYIPKIDNMSATTEIEIPESYTASYWFFWTQTKSVQSIKVYGITSAWHFTPVGYTSIGGYVTKFTLALTDAQIAGYEAFVVVPNPSYFSSSEWWFNLLNSARDSYMLGESLTV